MRKPETGGYFCFLVRQVLPVLLIQQTVPGPVPRNETRKGPACATAITLLCMSFQVDGLHINQFALDQSFTVLLRWALLFECVTLDHESKSLKTETFFFIIIIIFCFCFELSIFPGCLFLSLLLVVCRPQE